jgi:hypothetical protein
MPVYKELTIKIKQCNPLEQETWDTKTLSNYMSVEIVDSNGSRIEFNMSKDVLSMLDVLLRQYQTSKEAKDKKKTHWFKFFN